MSIKVTNNGASGSGQNELDFDFNRNKTRSQQTYYVKTSGSKNRIQVIQAFSALSITTQSDTYEYVSTTTAKTWQFTGKANGKYLRFVSSSGITVSGFEEKSAYSYWHSAGTGNYTEVMVFSGGSQMYDFRFTANMPANLNPGSYTVAIYTCDNASGTGEISHTFTVTVAEAPDVPIPVTSVVVIPGTLTTGIGSSYASRNQLSYQFFPADATIDSIVWRTDDSTIADVNSTTGLVNGVSQGVTNVGVVVTDTGGGRVWDDCRVTVWESGQMSAESVTARGVDMSASTTLTLTNIELNSLALSIPSGTTWVNSGTFDTTNYPYRLILSIDKNNGATSEETRSVSLTVSGTDKLGVTKNCQFTLSQTSYELPCTSMSIGGSATINNSGNSAEYTASYQPSGTTQVGCVWSVSGAGANYVTLDTSQPNLCTVHVLQGASNSQITLRATNSYNNQVYADKTITVTHVYESGYITATPASVRLAAVDTVNDHDNGAPVITWSNIRENTLGIDGTSGFISSQNAQLVQSGNHTYLETSFSANELTSERQATVTLTAQDLNGDTVPPTIVGYTQAGAQPVDHSSIAITSFTISNMTSPGKLDAILIVNYHNGNTTSRTFYTPSIVIHGYDSNDTLKKSITISASNVVVPANTTSPVTYNNSAYSELRWTGSFEPGDYYKAFVSSGTVESLEVTATLIDE